MQSGGACKALVTMSDIVIRPERPGDEAAIRHVNELAFGRPAEAKLVDALRANGAMTLSLVAEQGGQIVGHILFSPVTITSDSGVTTAVGLAPMAVVPSLQRGGVGAQLVRAGLDTLREAGHEAVIVLGHSDYYPRFGFERASRFGISWEIDCPDEAFMAVELKLGALKGKSGVVQYRHEFNDVS